MKQKRRRLLKQAFNTTGATKIFLIFLIFFLLSALIIMLVEPTIHTYFDSLWYCFVAISTIGFGDLTATVPVTRILTVLLWIYAAGVIAIFTAVITSFFMDAAKLRTNESARAFLDELERLPELSKEELENLSERVKKFNKQ
ncbi:MAG: two pore domain potassium channel family protein [Ruminococcus sp.]|nr:two pore domain potassium channel family protein [Ruminococcus sp.]